MPTEIIRLYRKAKVFQINLSELYNDEKPVSLNLADKFSLKGEINLKLLSNEIRNELGISLEDQFQWRSTKDAFNNWRDAFERSGVFVFKDAFLNDDYSGFCVYDIKYPIIYVNNSTPESRQIFTLFHELGHLLYNLGGIDFRDNRMLLSVGNRFLGYERKCNAFAAEFLVPSDIFETFSLKVSEKNIINLANKFSVSREVILRKFMDRQLVDQEYYNSLVEKWAKSSKQSKGGHYYYTHITYLGKNYIELVFSKYYKNKITRENMSEYLNVKEKNLSSLEHYVYG